MSTEKAFLTAISADPDDLAVRLIYADWLEERGDVRSEFVRVQVQLFGLKAGAPEYQALKLRENDLRVQCPTHWAAILDPGVWCLVGNVIDEHASGPSGQETRRGTRLFRPNAKIYLANMRHSWGLTNPAVSDLGAIQVI